MKRNTFGITKEGFSRIAQASKSAKKPSDKTLVRAYQAIQSWVEEQGYNLLEGLSNVKGPSYGSYGDLLSSGGEFEMELDESGLIVNGIINDSNIEIYISDEDDNTLAEDVINF